jgi:hypothetical protein
MNGGIREFGLTLALEVAPALLFAASVGVAASTVTGQPLEIGVPAAACAAGFLVAWAALRRFGSAMPRYALPPFDSAAIPLPDEAEPAEEPSSDDELLLVDVLAEPPPDSRVIRLFDFAATLAAAEAQSPVDHHARLPAGAAPAPDATRELHEALDALRRSLR